MNREAQYFFCTGLSLLLASAFIARLALAQSVPPASSLPQPESVATYSSKGSLGGITYTVAGLKRNANGTLTMSLRLQGTPGQPVDNDAIAFSSGEPTQQGYKLLDMANKRRYLMLQDSSGYCLCTHLTGSEISDLSSGKPRDIRIKFPAPPPELTHISVEVPHAEPIEEVPITN